MRLARFLQIMAGVTILALVYVHMQMQIIDLAYRGKAREQHIRKLIEENGNITYNILTMKSANHIGIKMLAEDTEMQFVDPNNIVLISNPTEVSEENSTTNLEEETDRKKNPLLSFLSFSTEAQARLQE